MLIQMFSRKSSVWC